jgi:hypothetical protein
MTAVSMPRKMPSTTLQDASRLGHRPACPRQVAEPAIVERRSKFCGATSIESRSIAISEWSGSVLDIGIVHANLTPGSVVQFPEFFVPWVNLVAVVRFTIGKNHVYANIEKPIVNGPIQVRQRPATEMDHARMIGQIRTTVGQQMLDVRGRRILERQVDAVHEH